MTPRYITMRNGRTAKSGPPDMDSDRREDENQERQLDQSFDDWVMSRIEDQADRQHLLINVPDENVFETAVDMDKE